MAGAQRHKGFAVSGEAWRASAPPAVVEDQAAPEPEAVGGGEAAPPPAAEAVRALSPMQWLLREPTLFSLDQAVAVLAPPGGDPLRVSYRTVARLGHPAGEVVAARPAAMELVAPTFGLIGPGGVLPRHVTATVAADLRRRSPASHAFVDMLARRFTGRYVRAGAKYRPTRDPAMADRILSAAIGTGTPHLSGRLSVPDGILLHHAGHLAARTRSAERLRAMLEEEAGAPVEIEEFVGGWSPLPERERTRLAGRELPTGQHARLGEGAAVGAAVWDPQARFVVRIGPMRRPAFEALLPGRPLHARLMELTRLHVGAEQGFALNPSLAPAEVPALRLDAEGARLGWTSWLGGGEGRAGRGTEPVFGPDAARAA
jgi:type VI secretion system protein ImpH